MSRHKVDVYVDGSLAKDNTAGTGVYLEFNNSKTFKLGVKEDKKTTHIEAVELRAVERILSRLNGGSKDKKISNSKITIYIDSVAVIDFLEKDSEINSLHSSTKASCKTFLKNIRNSKFNNVVQIVKVDREKNKAHELAYNAAVNGIGKKEGDIGNIIELSIVKKPVSNSSTEEVKPNLIEKSLEVIKENSMSKIINYLLEEAKRITFLETQISEKNEVIKSLNKLVEEKSNASKKYYDMFKDASDKILDRNEQIIVLKKENKSLRDEMESIENNYSNSIAKLNKELDLYKRKVSKLEKQRKIRNLREKINRNFDNIQTNRIFEEEEVLSQAAISIDYELESNATSIVVKQKDSKSIFPKVLKKLVK